jgi:hypothetical protein
VPYRPPGSSNLQTNGAVKAEEDPRSFFVIHRRKSVGSTVV